jgi:hypothetical protein
MLDRAGASERVFRDAIADHAQAILEDGVATGLSVAQLRDLADQLEKTRGKTVELAGRTSDTTRTLGVQNTAAAELNKKIDELGRLYDGALASGQDMSEFMRAHATEYGRVAVDAEAMGLAGRRRGKPVRHRRGGA